MTACLIVRARIADASLKERFERWYRDEHLPQALKAFRARRAWRGWSATDPAAHFAVYEFADMAAARAIETNGALARLVAEFDRAWRGEVTRVREFVEVGQAIEA